MRALAILLCALPLRAVTLVGPGRAPAVVITPDQSSPVAAYAAQELAQHVRRMTGAELTVVPEAAAPPGAARVFDGPCAAARAAGIEPAVPPDAFRIAARGDDLYVLGGDGDGPALDQRQPAGTLFGVYELLEGWGVRWLWPGEAGTLAPHAATLEVPAGDRTVPPRLLQRNVRPGYASPGDPQLAFSPAAREQYQRDQAVFLRRHRMGRVRAFSYGHAFEDWWQRYGEAYPDWFQLVGGKRGTPGGGRSSMCVSNPGFHQQVIANWLERRTTDPAINVNGCENDVAGLCECERCRAEDGPQPAPGTLDPRFGPRVVSDRYARFWLSLQQLAARHDPEAVVVGYAYVNYAPPPSDAIHLNDHVYVGTVPDLFFPRTDAEQAWVKTQWGGWSRTGCRLFLRPNYFLDGYTMPHLFVHQFADEFGFEAAHGMVFTDFDSLTGQWAAQGPNLYVLCRLHVRPERSTDELLAEYYGAFGPAAEAVRTYFDHWEQYTTQNEAIRQAGGGRWTIYPRLAPRLFPPAALDEGRKLLDAAAELAKPDPEAAQRVEFLRLGLEHARLCVAVGSSFAGGGDETYAPAAARRAYDALVAFRRRTERLDIANFDFCSYLEARAWRQADGYGGEPLQAVSATVQPLQGEPLVPVRTRTTFVAILAAGEPFRAKLHCALVGHYTSPLEWSLYGPDSRRIATGTLQVGESALVEQPATAAGVYVLLVDAGANGSDVALLNDHAAAAARSLRLVTRPARLWFMVPAGAKDFGVVLDSPAPDENAKLTILDPDGRAVAEGFTGAQKRVIVTTRVGPGQDGRAWSIATGKAPTGAMEDYTVTLDERLPAYWSLAPDRLVGVR